MTQQAERAAESLIALLAGTRRDVGRTVLLSGPWGCGKTFLWKADVAPKLGRPSVYVSAFGAEDSRQFKTRLVTQLMIGATELQPADHSWQSKIPAPLRRWLSSEAAGSSANALLNSLLRRIDLDPLELSFVVKPDTVICIDDLERASPAFRIEELFGITTFLSERKGLDVCIICNDDEMRSGGERGVAYSRYKEKAVFREVALRADIPALFDRVTRAVVSDAAAREQLGLIRPVLVDTFQRAASENLRVLARVASSVEELQLAGFDFGSSSMRLLSMLHIEAAAGRVQPAAFYEFDDMAVRLLQRLNKEGNPTQQARLELVERYFGEEPYTFDPIIFDLVHTGTVDRERIRVALSPQPAPTRWAKISSQLREASWRWASDQVVAELIDDLTGCMAEDSSLTATQILEGLAYARFLGEISGTPLAEPRLAQISSRLGERAKAGDSVDDGASSVLFLSDFRKYIQGEWDAFHSQRNKAERSKAAACIEEHATAGSLVTLAKVVANSHGEALRALVDELTTGRLFAGRRRDPEGFVLLVGVVLERLISTAADLESGKARRDEIVAELKRIASDPNEAYMDRWRATQALPRRG